MRKAQFAALALSAVLALFVGVWAYVLPQSFYDLFPGIPGPWVSVDGPFNEHLVRDVGGMYLALAAASVAGLIWRSPVAYRLLGIAWTVFGALHFVYHVLHLDHMTPVDAVGEAISLLVSLLLGVILLLPAGADRKAVTR
ncbi:hypothetical protein [Leifsonia virtsii]|uniref:DUF4345 domain-containing protein n=1 Tax=Leifsonia virtsii TaxID=3035915 RepID=A0ABT8IVK7_9MICO|nr:hypothetical protein [Leifsonia virtsii]MDN4596840.1 hypothetical protein [Leifsonia virtsii]